jgi:hypothetical protein
MATIAGVLDIIAGIMSLIGAGALFILGVVGTGAVSAAATQDPEALPVAFIPIALFGPLALLCLTIGFFAVIGGVAAIRRRKMWLAIVGAIAALFSFFPFGIPAIILTVMAEKDFR